MDRVREVCSAALSVREQDNLRVRLPLAELVVAAHDAGLLEGYKDLVHDELNVKQVTLSTDLAKYRTLELKLNPGDWKTFNRQNEARDAGSTCRDLVG
jgi:Isoleucyl-tRNA synthetase